MTKIDTSRPETVLPTPSHTVGPFYGHALPFPGGGDIAPIGHPDTIVLQGYITDGGGNPLPDAFLELWSADPDGNVPQVDGSIRRDPASGGYLGRNGVEFTGWGRIQTDANGHWTAWTLRPGARGRSAPYISVRLRARAAGAPVHPDLSAGRRGGPDRGPAAGPGPGGAARHADRA